MQSRLSGLLAKTAVFGLLLLGGCSKVSEAAVSDAPSKNESTADVKAQATVDATAQATNAVDTENFRVRLSFEEPCKKGETCTALVTVDAKGGYHINDKYPYRFKLTDPAPAGVKYPKPVVGRDDGTFSETKAVLRVPFVAESAGEAKVGGTLSFSVCSDEKCLIEKQALEATAKVE